MKRDLRTYALACCFLVVLFLSSCQAPGGNNTGSEYMPDMAHSVAYEANYYNYYYNNTWGSEEEYYEFAKPRKPVNGTVPRGYAAIGLQGGNAGMDAAAKVSGTHRTSDIKIPINGSVPYYYGDTEEERNRAMAEITNNPFPITADGLAKGKELYVIYCGICHGDKGDGAGYLVRDDGGVYPAAPANFLLEEHVQASEGRYYHSIMYGKNVMGAYKDKLSYEERWQVIHYIRSLQAKELKLEYSEEANTLNSSAIPGASMAMADKAPTEEVTEVEENNEESHGSDSESHNNH